MIGGVLFNFQEQLRRTGRRNKPFERTAGWSGRACALPRRLERGHSAGAGDAMEVPLYEVGSGRQALRRRRGT